MQEKFTPSPLAWFAHLSLLFKHPFGSSFTHSPMLPSFHGSLSSIIYSKLGLGFRKIRVRVCFPQKISNDFRHKSAPNSALMQPCFQPWFSPDFQLKSAPFSAQNSPQNSPDFSPKSALFSAPNSPICSPNFIPKSAPKGPQVWGFGSSLLEDWSGGRLRLQRRRDGPRMKTMNQLLGAWF